jgi:hypothetical protein
MLDSQFITQHGPEDLDLKLRGMVEKVSWIFRSVDWNDDGMPDNLGFSVHKVNRVVNSEILNKMSPV